MVDAERHIGMTSFSLTTLLFRDAATAERYRAEFR